MLRDRIIWIKACLSSIPFYYPSFFGMPVRVVKRVKKIMRKFSWARTGKAHKDQLVNWEVDCRSKTYGDLGIRNLI